MEYKIECPGCGNTDIEHKGNMDINGDIVDYFHCSVCGKKFTIQSSVDDDEFQDNDV
jgi:transposase-like protein